MQIDWVAYQFREIDGYGRWSNRYIQTLQRLGHDVTPRFAESVQMPAWMKAQVGIQPDTFTISCIPPIYLQDAPSEGRHWLITMTEGSEAPDGWCDIINARHIERVIVPCEYNAKAFREGGVNAPIHVIPGGTDPAEFPVRAKDKGERMRDEVRSVERGTAKAVDLPSAFILHPSSFPYTFLALADRGARKGWTEVYAAFYKAFGTPTDTPDVRLIIKARPESNDLLDLISKASNLDPRLQIIQADMDMRELYAMADCFAIPSRSEGWGMPHREAAMMGLPVITQAYSGMDDGHTACWSMPIVGGKLEPIPSQFDHIKGQWMRADVVELSRAMYWCYMNPADAAFAGQEAAEWLAAWQTWEHSARALMALIEEYS